MSEVPRSEELDVGGTKPSMWTRLFRIVFPGTTTRRWDRLPEGSQQDAAHKNMRSGM